MTLGLSETTGIGRLLTESYFSVPNHQRDYSWTEDEVKEFISDLTEAMNSRDDIYFLGLMVFLGDKSDNLTVLDGQQRLATSVALLSAIRGWLNQYSEYNRDADDIQRDYIGKRELGQSAIAARLILNSANNEIFERFIVNPSSRIEIEDAISRLKRRDRNRRLLEAALFVHKRVYEMADGHRTRSEAAEYFFKMVNYMRDKFGIVKLVVPNEEMAYTIFETLNDRGLELSPLDLVKNHFFGRAASHSSIRLRALEERWAQMMHTLSNVRSDSFLKAFWTSRHGRIRTRTLFIEFKKTYPDAQSTNELSLDMLDASERYAALETADDPTWAGYSEKTRDSVRAFRVIGSQQAHPVMLAALAKMLPREVERLFNLLEVCTVRYLLIGGENTGRFETSCAILAGKIYAGSITTATEARTELRDIYPDDNQFRDRFATKEEDNNQKALYYIKKLEVEQRRASGKLMPGELQPGTLTLEHILPQKPGQEWSDVLQKDPALAEECTYRLGNMCLLTDINRKLGRKNFQDKRVIFGKSDLETTKELDKADQGEQWGRKSIEQRQIRFAKLAVSAWRFQ